MPKITRRQAVIVSVALTAVLLAWPYQAHALENKLVVVTSYPPDTTVTVKKAFEAKHPGVTVEMLKKKTTIPSQRNEIHQGGPSQVAFLSRGKTGRGRPSKSKFSRIGEVRPGTLTSITCSGVKYSSKPARK